MPEHDAPVKVSMTAEMWAAIDSVMDNEGQLANDNGDDETAQAAEEIRSAGLADVATWAPREIVPIVLSRVHWKLVLDSLAASSATWDELQDPEVRRRRRGSLERPDRGCADRRRGGRAVSRVLGFRGTVAAAPNESRPRDVLRQ